MSVRQVDGDAGRVERWLDNLSTSSAATDPQPYPGPDDSLPRQPDPDAVKCPVCDKPRTDYGAPVERYDEDYDYYWGSFRLPLWIALIWQVPWRQRLDIFVIGFIVGIVIAGLGLLWGFVLSQY